MRHQNWALRLIEHLDRVQRGEPRYALYQCPQFVRDAVNSMFIEPVYSVPDVDSAKTSRALVAARSVEDRVADVLGQPIAIALASRGDVVLLRQGKRPALGICLGSESVFLHATTTLQHCETLRCDMAWRVA